jgi:hypothetical protein
VCPAARDPRRRGAFRPHQGFPPAAAAAPGGDLDVDGGVAAQQQPCEGRAAPGAEDFDGEGVAILRVQSPPLAQKISNKGPRETVDSNPPN